MLLISFLFPSFCFIKCRKRQYLIKIKIKGKTGAFLNSNKKRLLQIQDRFKHSGKNAVARSVIYF